jgi:hypothetical protein
MGQGTGPLAEVTGIGKRDIACDDMGVEQLRL